MEIRYAPNGGPKRDECWKTWRDGNEILYKRVAAGVALPKPEQPQGCWVVLGELYRPTGAPTFTALGAKVGVWPDLEQGFGELRQEFKVGLLVTEPDDEAREILYRVPALKWASGEIPMSILAAPKYALGEVAKQRVDTLIREDRLNLKPVRDTLDEATEQAALALQCLVARLIDSPAHYEGPREPLKYKRILGDYF